MVCLSRALAVLAAVALTATGTDGQQRTGPERAYFRAVARYFQLPEEEVSILGSWDVPADEIPVVLFVANRAGVSSEALIALRESGRSWTDLARRYHIGAAAFHVPIHDFDSAGSLSPLYERYRDLPVSDWASIDLSESDIVALVNVRVLARSLGVRPEEVMRRTGTTDSYVALYTQLLH